MQAERGDGFMPEMPPVEMAGHLLRYLFEEVGPTMQGPAGPVPVSHQEIRAWQSLSCICLAPLEALFLRRLSAEYIAELHEAENPLRPAPWADAPPVVDPNSAAERMRRALSGSKKEDT